MVILSGLIMATDTEITSEPFFGKLKFRMNEVV
jgi:hypothetical protein